MIFSLTNVRIYKVIGLIILIDYGRHMLRTMSSFTVQAMSVSTEMAIYIPRECNAQIQRVHLDITRLLCEIVAYIVIFRYILRFNSRGQIYASRFTYQKIVPKLINTAAYERHKESTIIAAHDKCVPRLKQEKIEGAGLNVRIDKNGKRFFSQLTGHIDKSFNAMLMNYGAGFTG